MTDMVVSTSDNQILSFNYKPSIEAKKFSIKGVKNGSVTVSIEVTDIF